VTNANILNQSQCGGGGAGKNPKIYYFKISQTFNQNDLNGFSITITVNGTQTGGGGSLPLAWAIK
jgi:hypothetical protein